MPITGFTRSRTRSRKVQGTRRGAMIILIALLLPVLVILVGFSVDLAHMQRVRTEMRAVADLSAKAAAGELSRTHDIVLARIAAKDVASENTVAGKPKTLEDSDIVFGRSIRQGDGTWTYTPNATPFNAVRVHARRTTAAADGPVSLLFGHFYNRSSFEPELAATCSFLAVDGPLLVSAFGRISQPEVDGTLIVDTGHVVAFSDGLTYSIDKVGGGWFNTWLSGEGFVLRFSGRGRILLQSHNPHAFGAVLGPQLPERQN